MGIAGAAQGALAPQCQPLVHLVSVLLSQVAVLIGEEENVPWSTEEWWPDLDQLWLCAGDKCCKIHYETVWNL